MPPQGADGPFGHANQNNDGLRNAEMMNFHPPQNNEMHFMDDDEDLR